MRESVAISGPAEWPDTRFGEPAFARPDEAQPGIPGRLLQLIPIDIPQVRPSLIGGLMRRFIRRGYGIYKLARSPRQAYQLITAQPETALHRLVTESGHIAEMAARPFVCSEWSGTLRLQRMIDHCAIVDALGHPFDVYGHLYVVVAAFDLEGDHCRLMLDQPAWLDCDGLLSVSLWVGADRVITISFCLAETAAGRTAYVGGIQGKRSARSIEQNRLLTKVAHGLRPRDFAFELFRMLLPHLGVTQLKCVDNAHRYQLTRRARIAIGAADRALLDYDEIWESRSGVRGSDGFFTVPITKNRRDPADIPAKKRRMYASRYAMLDRIEAGIASAPLENCAIQVHSADFF